MNKPKSFSFLLILILVTSAFVFFSPFSVKAQNEPTLAETINNVVSYVQTTDSPWTVLYSQIFGLRNQSAYDDAIEKALNQNDYQNVIFIARLAEINAYTSQTINNSLITALQNMPMSGSLPTVSDSFLYDRYMINGYRYAQNLGTNGWNITQALLDFQQEYSLWNPSADRYYDEYAETLGMYLEFAINGNVDAAAISQIWNQTQGTWNGNYYIYKQAQPEYECEMGNFAIIAAEYKSYYPNIPFFDRVIDDLEYKLLSSGYNSPAWGPVGVVQHATDNSQLRLEETMGALVALQMLYPDFSSGNQINFQSMLSNGQMWRGLTNSSLYDPATFSFRVTDDNGTSYSDDMSMLGAMEMFLSGIIPGTGSLAIDARNEAYQDYRTCFPTSEWKFNYQNQSIRIPIIAGNLNFIFGSQQVTQDFPSNGIYDIQFSSNWNSVLSNTKVANIPSIVPLPTNSLPTLTPMVTFTPDPMSTALPTQSPPSFPSPISSATPTQATYPLQTWLIIALAAGIFVITSWFIVHLRNKTHEQRDDTRNYERT